MRDRLAPELDDVTRDFIEPEVDRLMREIDAPATPHIRRAAIGDRLAEIGDMRRGVGLIMPATGALTLDPAIGIPDITWCAVPGGVVTVEELGERRVQAFYMAKYPVTYVQFRAFRAQGYGDDRWWQGLSQDALLHQRAEDQQNRRTDNHPAEMVPWYEAMAFCAWLTSQYAQHGLFPVLSASGESHDDEGAIARWLARWLRGATAPGARDRDVSLVIRLPDEWEWQQAATAGHAANEFPWGKDWDDTRANTSESGLSRTTAAGMYPHGATRGEQPILDMSGNVSEWCLTPTPRIPHGRS